MLFIFMLFIFEHYVFLANLAVHNQSFWNFVKRVRRFIYLLKQGSRNVRKGSNWLILSESTFLLQFIYYCVLYQLKFMSARR